MKNIRFTLAFLLPTVLNSCGTNCKFDKIGWSKTTDLGVYPYRECMVDDLIKNHKLVGLKYKDLIEIIGDPNKTITETPNEIYYPISIEYSTDIDPVKSKTLVVVLSSDSLVKDYHLDTWHK